MEDPRLSEATEEQLRERLDELEREPFNPALELLKAANEARRKHILDVREVSREIDDLAPKARAKAATEHKDCIVCSAPKGTQCGAELKDTHMARVRGVSAEAIEKAARDLAPALFTRAKRLQREARKLRGPN